MQLTLVPLLTVKVLLGLWRNDLVALKGACPNCGEEVSQSPDFICIKALRSFLLASLSNLKLR